MTVMSKREGDIFAAVQVNALLSIAEIAEITKLKQHVVRSSLRRLYDAHGIFVTPLLNLTPLGFQEYLVYITLVPECIQYRDAIVVFILNHQLVRWVVEIGGDFHFVISMMGRSPEQISMFLDQIGEKFSSILLRKSIVVVVSFTHYGRRFLGDKSFWQPGIRVSAEKYFPYFDELDDRILKSMKSDAFRGLPEIARQLKEPLSTIRYREERLRTAGVIAGYVYSLGKVIKGLSSFRVLISVKGITPTVNKASWHFCNANPYVVCGVRTLGEWDYEIRAEMPSSIELGSLLKELQLDIGSALSWIRCEPDVQFVKSASYSAR